MNAIESSGYNSLADEITEEIVKRGEEGEDAVEQIPIDKMTESQYNMKKAKYISHSKIGEENIRFIRSEFQKIYKNQNGIADENLRAEFIRGAINDGLSNGNFSDGLSQNIRHRLRDDSGSNLRRESEKELSIDKRKSANKQDGVSRKNDDNGGLSQFSLNQSERNNISKEQQEYFKDSVIRDKMGDPSYIVKQNNGRYAEVISIYYKSKKNILVIDFAKKR